MNKQVPGSNLQIENQNLTFLDGIIDSSNKTNPTSKYNADKWHFPMASVCAMVAHTLELLLIKKWNFSWHMTEKESRCQLDVKDFRTDSTRPY